MNEEDRATVRNKLVGIDGIYKKVDHLLRALILSTSKAEAISREGTIKRLEDIRRLLADIPVLKKPIIDIVDKERPKN